MDDFNKQKIIYPCIMAKGSSFILDSEAIYYTVAPGNIITGNELEFLIGCLNSKIYYFAMRKFYMGGGIEGELKTNRLLILPVISPYNSNKVSCDTIINEQKNIQEKVIIGDDINENCKHIDNILRSELKFTDEEYNYIQHYIF